MACAGAALRCRVGIFCHIKAEKWPKKARRRKNAAHNFAVMDKNRNFGVSNCEKHGGKEPAGKETIKTARQSAAWHSAGWRDAP